MLLVGCGSDRDDPPDTADLVSRAPPPATAGPIDIAYRHLRQVPDSVLMRAGACPFECCVYGAWRADSTIVLLSRPESGAAPVDTLRPGEPFEARDGYVAVTGPGVVAVLDTVRAADGELILAPGDTLVVLDYVGEGVFNLWHDGRVLQGVRGFWGAETDDPRGAYFGDYQREWWVEAASAAGEAGWFRADDTSRYSGADACASPPA